MSKNININTYLDDGNVGVFLLVHRDEACEHVAEKREAVLEAEDADRNKVTVEPKNPYLIFGSQSG